MTIQDYFEALARQWSALLFVTYDRHGDYQPLLMPRRVWVH